MSKNWRNAYGEKKGGPKKPVYTQAAASQRFIASLIDLTVVVGFFYLICNEMRWLDFGKDFLFKDYLFLLVYMMAIFIVIPQTIFSQTLGSWLMRIKLLDVNTHQRIPFGTAILRSFVFLPLSLLLFWQYLLKKSTPIHDKAMMTKFYKMNNDELGNDKFDFFIFTTFHGLALCLVVVFTLAFSNDLGIADLNYSTIKTLVEKRIERFNKKEMIVKAKVAQLRGRAIVVDLYDNERDLVLEEVIHIGEKIKTYHNSFIKLVSNEGFEWEVRLGPNAEANFSKPLVSTSTMINHVRGMIHYNVVKKGSDFNVYTRNFSLNVRGTRFYVYDNSIDKVLTSVYSGLVRVEDSLGGVLMVEKEHTAMSLNNQMIALYETPDFVQSLETTLITHPEKIDESKIHEAMDFHRFEVSTIEQIIEKRKTTFESFLVELDDQKNLLQKIKTDLSLAQAQYEQEKKFVEEDSHCILVKNAECEIYSAEILKARGFETLEGKLNYRKAMVQSLSAYLDEQVQKIAQLNLSLATQGPKLEKMMAIEARWKEAALGSLTDEQIVQFNEDFPD